VHDVIKVRQTPFPNSQHSQPSSAARDHRVAPSRNVSQDALDDSSSHMAAHDDREGLGIWGCADWSPTAERAAPIPPSAKAASGSSSRVRRQEGA